jgi:hypothetical protein
MTPIEIFRRKLDRLTVRRTISRMVPGVAVTMQSILRRDVF